MGVGRAQLIISQKSRHMREAAQGLHRSGAVPVVVLLPLFQRIIGPRKIIHQYIPRLPPPRQADSPTAH